MKRIRIIAVFLAALMVQSAFAEPVYWLTLTGERNGASFRAPRNLIEAGRYEPLDIGISSLVLTVRAVPMGDPADAMILELLFQRPAKGGDRRVEQATTVVRLNELTAVQMDKDKDKMGVTILIEPAPGQVAPKRVPKPGHAPEPDPGVKTQPMVDYHPGEGRPIGR